MKLFYGTKSYPLEEQISSKTKDFIVLINKDILLKKYVSVFGMTGSAARGQAAYGKSDVDFYVLTNYLNPVHDSYLKMRFKEVFDMDYDVSVLVISPTIFERKDLMLYEFVNSGKIFYGKLNLKFDIDEVPPWEGIRLLSFKGNPFIANPSKATYAKLLLGIGEALLLLEGTYVADNFKRYKAVLKSKHTTEEFITEYKKAHAYRYFNKDIKVDKKKAYNLLREAWITSLLQISLRDVTPLTLRERIGTRLFYTIDHWRYFGKLRVTLKEPFIEEIKLIQKYLDNPSEKLRKRITMSWKASPRFWYREHEVYD